MKKLLLSFGAFLVAVSSYAFDCEVDGIYYNRTSASEFAVTYGSNRYTGNVVIPETVNYNGRTFTVTSIVASAFMNSTTLQYVSIPSTVKTIGEKAFYGCKALESIVIPEGITVIAKETFSGCSWLESVTIPESVQTISEKAFYQCGFLEELYLPKVTYIGVDAFCECKNLKTATFGVGLKTISNYAFFNCSSLSRILLPNGLTTIGQWAFANCVLESLKLPEGLTKLNHQAFGYCGIKLLYLPSTLTEMDVLPFFGCPIEKIYCAAQVPPYATIPKYDMALAKPFSNNIFTWAELYVPTGRKEVYSATPASFYSNNYGNDQHNNTFWGLFFSINEFDPETFDFETLGIDGIKKEGDINNQQSQFVYNMKGQLVRSNTTSTDGLPRGIYIINGRKVIVSK